MIIKHDDVDDDKVSEKVKLYLQFLAEKNDGVSEKER